MDWLTDDPDVRSAASVMARVPPYVPSVTCRLLGTNWFALDLLMITAQPSPMGASSDGRASAR